VAEPPGRTGEQRDDGLPQGKDHDHAGPAQGRRGAPWSAVTGNRPDGVERVLQRGGHAARAEQGADQSDHQRQAGAVQRVHAGLKLRPDLRVRAQRGIDHPLAQGGIVLEHDVEQRDKHKQQREDRQEREVRDQRGEVAGPVVAELLPHRDRERQRLPAALEAVGPADYIVK
jgi:hypothetical protein